MFALPFARCASLRWKRCCLPLQTADSHQAQSGANIQGQGGVEEKEEALSGPQRRPTQLAEKLEQDLDPWERGIKMGWVGWCGAAKRCGVAGTIVGDINFGPRPHPMCLTFAAKQQTKPGNPLQTPPQASPSQSWPLLLRIPFLQGVRATPTQLCGNSAHVATRPKSPDNTTARYHSIRSKCLSNLPSAPALLRLEHLWSCFLFSSTPLRH